MIHKYIRIFLSITPFYLFTCMHAERCRIGSGPQNEWYFFSHKDKKYPTGTRTNRATVVGFWKATGRDKPIYVSSNVVDGGGHKRIGMRKTLVFYMGRAPTGQKSHWIMHEYRLYHEDRHSKSQIIQGDGWVVCRVFRKKNYHHSHQHQHHQHQHQRGEELHRGALMMDSNYNPVWEFGHNSIVQQLLINPDQVEEAGLSCGGGGGGELNFNIGDWPILDKLVSSSHQNLEQLINHHGRIGVGHHTYNNYIQPQQSAVMMNTSTTCSGGGGGGGGGLMLQYHLGFQNN